MNPDPANVLGVHRAVEVCLGCPVFVECLTWVMALKDDRDPGGVIAGLTEPERHERRLNAGRTCTACGEHRAADQFGFHDRETGRRRAICKPCTQAANLARYHAQRRAA
ncbi:WhiB family transcriptional regulator [Acrocarpospora catenulata]|uniref:WhiB family transcriptional regulator n=1 Tax=Acrocarpospora catenulata TaxID=2836182 RepID=UPI001BDA1948|nr:WhiB family transcriptional regulator [Acrocarpospora catenulata]